MINRKPIALTVGDPAGIGPELILKALGARQPSQRQEFVLYGDFGLLTREAARLGLQDVLHGPRIVACSHLPDVFELGRISAAAGAAAAAAIKRAAQDALRGVVRAIVTAPIHKEALAAAGLTYPGHTEMLAALAGVAQVRMMLANDALRTVLVTIHMALREAIAAITTEGVLTTIELAQKALLRAGIAKPRIAVAGLNPHAGEGGRFGREEIELIAPAIQRAQALGIHVTGPWSPDTVFMRARGFVEFDVVIAMTHDHGLIPIKYLGLDKGVNATLGLPFVRTSPDHGTAFDIAGKGVADPRSFEAAIAMADELSA
jgi:4-hydroxythreonine-4-phosphate dehydrogenase